MFVRQRQSYEFLRMPTAQDEIRKSDLIKIHRFLLDDAALLARLTHLERALEQEAGEFFDQTTKTLQGFERGKPGRQFKIMSAYFAKWSAANGFKPFTKLKKFLDDFNSQLISQSLFKDAVLRGEFHGEWTHFIQWWCIVEEFKNTAQLSCTPAELYQWIGVIQAQLKTGKIWGSIFEITEGATFDHPLAFNASLRPPQPIGASVDSLNRFIKSEKGEEWFPLLSQLLQARDNKGFYKNTEPSDTTMASPLALDHAMQKRESIFDILINDSMMYKDFYGSLFFNLNKYSDALPLRGYQPCQ